MENKKKLKKIKLGIKKEVITNLSEENMNQIVGGAWTSGCTDGCTGDGWFQTWGNCTQANCSADCPGTIYPGGPGMTYQCNI